MEYHRPVLLNEAVNALMVKKEGVYVDATFGSGGHTAEILKRLGSKGRIYAFDQDEEAIQNKINDDRLKLLNENFRYMNRFLRLEGIKKIDGLLADLGVSSHQIDKAERGFSTRFTGRLDMRMSQKAIASAYDIVNNYEADKLSEIFYNYADLRKARKLAGAVLEARHKEPIKTTTRLTQILQPFFPRNKQHKILARIFQALRIEVNDEIGALRSFLSQSAQILKTKARLCVISYHSHEDRLVKRFMRDGRFEGEPEKDMYGRSFLPFKRLGKPVYPTYQEIKNNNRARSAIMRVAERTEENF